LRQRTTIVLLGAAASVVFMALALRRLDASALYASLRGRQAFPWIPLAVGSYLVGHVVRGFRCRLLVAREAALPLYTAANVVVVGYAANNVFPARLGELIRAGMLTERTGIPVAQSLTITLIERVLDGLAILTLLVVCLLSAEGAAPDFATHVVEVAAIVFGSALLGLLLAMHAPGLVVTIASRVGSRLPHGWHDRLVRLASNVTNAGTCLRDARGAAWLALSSLVIWVLEAGMFLAVLRAFSLPASPMLAGIAMSVTNLGLLVPSSPGFIGPFHYFCSRALMAYGIEQTPAVAYATAVHLTFFVPVTRAPHVLRAGHAVGSRGDALVRRAGRCDRGDDARRTRAARNQRLSRAGPLRDRTAHGLPETQADTTLRARAGRSAGRPGGQSTRSPRAGGHRRLRARAARRVAAATQADAARGDGVLPLRDSSPLSARFL
jgi:glycosyltransferase 2 family protein